MVPMKPVGGAPASLSAIAGSTRTVTNLVLPVRFWLLKRAFDYIRVDDNRGDFFVGHELLELAIGNRIGLPGNVLVLV